MRAISLLIALCMSLPTAAEDRMVNAWTIALTLNTPKTQWVFNHICVPAKMLEGHGFTQGEFVDAYLIVSQLRWEAALEALANDNEKESMRLVALIAHGMIDAYWPGRVERDGDGAITQFKDCAALGNLPGMLQEERSGIGPKAAVREEITKLMSQVLRKWKERKPFSEVAPLLVSGPMKIGASAEALPLAPK
jgi:hypothetical protein